MRNRHRTTWMRAGASLLVCLLGSIAVTTAMPPSYDGKWELGFYFPLGKFDTDVPVKDMMGDYTMNHCQGWSSFLTAGVGWFRSKALEAQHESFGGSVLAAGLGVRFYTSHRSSLFLMAQRARVNPNTFQPPPAVSDEDD